MDLDTLKYKIYADDEPFFVLEKILK